MTTGKTGIYMKEFKITKLVLSLFDSGAAGAASAAPTGTATGGETAAAEPAVGYRSRKQAAADRERMARDAILGKQAQPKAEQAAQQPENNNTAEEPKAPENEAQKQEQGAKNGAEQFEEMMKDSDFRKAFSDRAQKLIDQRFKETKGLQAKLDALEPMLETLSEKYGVEKNDIAALVNAISSDTELYDSLGEKHGMSGEQYKKMEAINRNARTERQIRLDVEARMRSQEFARRISAEAETVKQIYPDFDLATATANPQIRAMLKSGVSLKAAYEAVNLENIITQRTTQKEREVMENIQARASRPSEGGANSQSGAVAQNVVTRLTKQERENLAQRAIRGEKITLR